MVAKLSEVPDISDCMDHIGKAFEKWRYLHEMREIEAIRFEVLRFLRLLLYIACMQDSERRDVSDL